MSDTIKQIGNYTYNQRFCLGEGSFGKVFQGTSKTGKRVAIKKVDKKLIYSDQYLRESIESEITILKKFNHPNIVKLEDMVYTTNSIYIITEFCRNGDLKSYLRNRKLSEEEATRIMLQLANGMKEIVKHGIMHRDLKPANVLVHQGQFKICDFGFAKYFKQIGRMNKTCVGTPMYMSPQALKQKPYTNKSDVWSFGIVFYELVFNRPPWQGNGEEELYRNITSRTLQIPNCSKFTQTLLKGLLQVEEVDRWSWERVFEFVENPTFDATDKPSLFYQQQQIVVPTNSNPSGGFVPTNFSPFQPPQNLVKYVDIQSYPKNSSKQKLFEVGPQEITLEESFNQNSPQQKKKGDVKMKPKNMLAVFEEDSSASSEDPRFCYFVLVELLLNPIRVQSFDLFMSSLFETTLQSYYKSLEKAEAQFRDLLASEIQELKTLGLKNIGNKSKMRQLGRQVLNQAPKDTQMNRQWIKRLIDRRYIYDPL